MKKYFFTSAILAMTTVFFLVISRPSKADFFGGDLPILAQILAKAIEQIQELQQIIGTTQKTAGFLEDLDRGVKEVLRLAETAHVPLPPQVYSDARKIEDAAQAAIRDYGVISENAPIFQKNQRQSGVESLFISQDAFDYSTFLDKNGDEIKRSAVISDQVSATRLTAESLGVLLHAVSHTNRILAKDLELSSSVRLEQTAKENAQFDTFMKTGDFLENDFSTQEMTPLNSFGAISESAGGH